MTTDSAQDASERQNGDYEVPILAEPEGGPVPDGEDEDDGG